MPFKSCVRTELCNDSRWWRRHSGEDRRDLTGGTSSPEFTP
jgi:hypothetical protein